MHTLTPQRLAQHLSALVRWMWMAGMRTCKQKEINMGDTWTKPHDFCRKITAATVSCCFISLCMMRGFFFPIKCHLYYEQMKHYVGIDLNYRNTF